MTNPLDAMFTGGGGAPSFKFDTPGDTVQGKILSLDVQGQTSMKDGSPVLDDQGRQKQQVCAILETALRGWQGCKAQVDDNGQPRNPADDNGHRAIYIKGMMLGAVGDAVNKATGRPGAPEVGGMLAVRFTGERQSNRSQYMVKQYEAHYKAPNPADAAFAQAAPQQAPQAPQQQGWGAPQQAPQAQAQLAQAAYAPQPQAPQQQAYAPPQAPAQAPQQGWGPPPAQPAVQAPAAPADPWGPPQPQQAPGAWGVGEPPF